VRQSDIAGNISIAATIGTGGGLPPGLETSSIKYLSSTGHYYEYVSGGLSWTVARAAAANRTFNGATGYLATVTSAAENNFLANLIGGYGWIGASDADIEQTAVRYAQQLGRYPDWPELTDLPECVSCEVPTGERPQAATAGRAA
jgi:hypothetical protein